MGLLGVAQNAFRALRGDDQARYLLAERAAARIHPDGILSDRDRRWLHEEGFRRLYDRFERESRRRMDRVWLLREFARRSSAFDGETAECGVFAGLTSYVIASSAPSKTHHAFDSFAGLSAPTAADGDYWQRGDLAADLASVKRNLDDLTNIEYHPGWIPERFDEVGDRRFALVHIDVDLAEPTLASLEFFGARMVPGGVIVLDDHGSELCPGATKVAAAYASEAGVAIIDAPTGQGIILDLGR